MQKLFVGVSISESLSVVLVTDIPFGVQLLPLPLESLPIVVAVLFELSSNLR